MTNSTPNSGSAIATTSESNVTAPHRIFTVLDWLSKNPRRPLFMMLVIVLGFVGARLATGSLQLFCYDFSVYYTAGGKLLDGERTGYYDYWLVPRDEGYYHLLASLEFSQKFLELHNYHELYPKYPALISIPNFVYSPPFIILFTNFAWLPYNWAAGIWYLLNLYFVIHAVYLTAARLPLFQGRWWPLWFTGLCLAALFSSINLLNLVMGQTSALLLMLFLGAWRLDEDGWPEVAAVMLALAVSMKIFPALILIWWVMRKRWWTLSVFVMAIVALHAVTFALLGKGIYSDYFSRMSEIGKLQPVWAANQSIMSLLLQWSLPGTTGPLLKYIYPPDWAQWAAHAVRALELITLIPLIWAAKRGSMNNPIFRTGCFAYLCMVSIRMLPVSWLHYYLLAMPLGVWMLGAGVEALAGGLSRSSGESQENRAMESGRQQKRKLTFKMCVVAVLFVVYCLALDPWFVQQLAEKIEKFFLLRWAIFNRQLLGSYLLMGISLIILISPRWQDPHFLNRINGTSEKHG